MMRILVIDNYDSFTYNLVQFIQELVPCPVDVYRNDKIALPEIEFYDCIIISPGPGIPKQAGITMEAIREYYQSKAILGVCLGHQAIGEVFGGKLINLDQVFHGVATQTKILDNEDPIFRGLPDEIEVGRYHSWIVALEDLPEEFKVLSIDKDNVLMAIRLKDLPVWGVQFHPESILTPQGKVILSNFLKAAEHALEKRTEEKDSRTFV